MTANEHKRELFDGLVRLRRLGRVVPGSEDLMVVRSRWERELGPTMSRRLGADVLGVSHTALDRWIRDGDIPVVFAPTGRTELPVNAVLDLYELVESERAGGRRRHVLEPVMQAARRRAQQLDPIALLGGSADGRSGHGSAEARGLVYHRALAERLDDAMVVEAGHRLWRWRHDARIDPSYADQWDVILDQSVSEIRDAISANTQTANDLRQNSPFAGMLSEPERRRIVAALG